MKTFKKVILVIALSVVLRVLVFRNMAVPLYIFFIFSLYEAIKWLYKEKVNRWLVSAYFMGALFFLVLVPQISSYVRQGLPYLWQALYERGLTTELDVGKTIKPELDPTVKKEIFDHVTRSRLAWDSEQLKKLRQIDKEYKTGKITIEEKEVEEGKIFRKLIDRHSELNGKLNLVNEPSETSPPLTTPPQPTFSLFQPAPMPTLKPEDTVTKEQNDEKPSSQETIPQKPASSRIVEVDLYGIERNFGFFPVKGGDEIVIKSVGEICLVNSSGKRICSGPDGIDNRPFPAYPPIRLSNKGDFLALVGKFGENGEIFSVGRDFKRVAEKNEDLHLYLNVSREVRDIFSATGKFHTVVKITPAN